MSSFFENNVEERPIDYIFKEIEKKLIIPRPIFMNKIIPKNKPENERGNREYKYLLNYNLMDQSEYREKREKKKKEKIASQMLYRLLEGNGKAIYIIGIDDDGTNKGIKLKELFDSIHFFIDASKIINAKIKSIKIYKGIEGYISTIRISLDVNLDYNITLF
jgi:GTPase